MAKRASSSTPKTTCAKKRSTSVPGTYRGFSLQSVRTVATPLSQSGYFENVIGSTLNDTLLGNGAANLIKGNTGNDTIRGVQGNDLLYGELGDDTRFATFFPAALATT